MSVEKIREEYDVVTIPLSANMTDAPFYFDANTIIVAQVPIAVNVKINDVSNKSMNLQIFRRFDMKVTTIFITTTTTSTTDLILFASKTVSVATGGFGAQVILADSLASEYDARNIIESAIDSSEVNINNGASRATATLVTTGFNKICVTVYCSHALTVQLEGTIGEAADWREFDEVAVAATTPISIEWSIVSDEMRIRFSNGSGANSTECDTAVYLSSGA